MKQLFLLFFCLLQVSQGGKVSNRKTSCTGLQDTSVWQEGCLVHTCKGGIMQQSFAEECVELIKKKVEEVVEKKLTEIGCSSETQSSTLHYKNPGIIIAGGLKQTSVKLYKPETNEVCDLPNTPDRFNDHSFDLVDGTLIMCGSYFGSPGKARMKNETELHQFFAVSTCLQLSPKDTEWTIFAKIPLKRQHVSLVTDKGVLLIGGYNDYSVNLVKKDGTVDHVWDLKRYIDHGCGINDGNTLVVTGGGIRDYIGAGGFTYYESTATKTVDRYNAQGHVEDLPGLLTDRRTHGCGLYHKDGKKILLVAGGLNANNEKLSSTEIFKVGESTEWTYAAPLPRAMDGMSYASLNNMIYFIEDKSSGYWTKKSMVVEFDGDDWTDKLELTDYGDTKRSAAVAVDLSTSGFKDFCN